MRIQSAGSSLFHLILFCIILLAPSELRAQTRAWVVGIQGWWSVGDIVEFVGDCTTSAASCDYTCDAWSGDDCTLIDFCLRFRKISGADLENCTYETSVATYGCVVQTCYWMNVIGDCATKESPGYDQHNFLRVFGKSSHSRRTKGSGSPAATSWS